MKTFKSSDYSSQDNREMVESAWANIGFSLHYLDPEIRKIIRS